MQYDLKADRAVILRTLDALFPQRPVVELRYPDYPRRNKATAGYFDDYEALADAAVRLNSKCPGGSTADCATIAWRKQRRLWRQQRRYRHYWRRDAP